MFTGAAVIWSATNMLFLGVCKDLGALASGVPRSPLSSLVCGCLSVFFEGSLSLSDLMVKRHHQTTLQTSTLSV